MGSRDQHTRTGTRNRSIAGLVVALLTAAVVWWTQGDDAAQQPADPAESASAESPSTSPTASSSSPSPSDALSESASEAASGGGTDPDSGLPYVAEADLPPEAADTLRLIDQGGPFPYEEDGSTFQNREGILPDRPPGYYAEHTVETPGLDHRGARRIVSGDGDELYWTDDHYASFSRIQRAAGAS